MIVLTIRTDNPMAEIGLYDGQNQLAYKSWHAHRALAETLHGEIWDMLQMSDKTLEDLQGIVCYKGPGSFTGLRIGLTVGNALSYGLGVPIAAETGESWQLDGIVRITKGESVGVALPHYGADVHITPPKK